MQHDLEHPAAGGFARLYWMMLGNVAVLMTALAIARMPTWTIGWRDVLYALFVVGLVAVRWFDVTKLEGRTADGAPATLSDWRRFSMVVAALGAAAWIYAQSVEL
jgi:hypothetical protein